MRMIIFMISIFIFLKTLFYGIYEWKQNQNKRRQYRHFCPCHHFSYFTKCTSQSPCQFVFVFVEPSVAYRRQPPFSKGAFL